MRNKNNTTGATVRNLKVEGQKMPATSDAGAAAHSAGAKIPYVDPAKQWECKHGNHFCVACEDCGRVDPRNLH